MKHPINHKKVADKVETISMGLGITSGLAAMGAQFAMPTGFSAIGVALGLSSPPLIVTAAPIIGTAATVSGIISGGVYFYSKWKSRKARKKAENRQSDETITEDG